MTIRLVRPTLCRPNELRVIRAPRTRECTQTCPGNWTSVDNPTTRTKSGSNHTSAMRTQPPRGRMLGRALYEPSRQLRPQSSKISSRPPAVDGGLGLSDRLRRSLPRRCDGRDCHECCWSTMVILAHLGFVEVLRLARGVRTGEGARGQRGENGFQGGGAVEA